MAQVAIFVYAGVDGMKNYHHFITLEVSLPNDMFFVFSDPFRADSEIVAR